MSATVHRMRYRVKWYFSIGPYTTFSEFGQAFMLLLREQRWQFTGTMDVTNGVALLDGFMLSDESVDFHDLTVEWANRQLWTFGGHHHWEF